MPFKKVYNEEEMEEILLRPYNYVLQTRVYEFSATKFPEAFNYWLHIPKDKLKKIQEIIVIMNHSLAICDDVADDALFRRCVPAAHRVFGTAITINCSFHTQFLALEKIIQLGHPEGAEVYCKGVLNSVRGMGTDLYWRNNQTDITHEHYKQMAMRKSGDVLLFIVQLMQLFSDNKTNYQHFLLLFGVYFQIRDDYCNLKKPEELFLLVMTNRLRKKFDGFQPPEQAGFRRGFSTIDHIHTIRQVVQKTHEYNQPLCLAFVDYEKACDCRNLGCYALEEDRTSELQNLSKIDFCEDLTDGKISFPVIHSLKSPSRDIILGILKMHTRDIRTKEYLLTLLEQTGGIQYTRDVLRELEVELQAEVTRLGGNPLLEDLLRDFNTWEE